MVLGREVTNLTPPEDRGGFVRASFYSDVRHCQMIKWAYRDKDGDLHTGIATSERAARESAERASGEKIE